jgi:hypothetical protein
MGEAGVAEAIARSAVLVCAALLASCGQAAVPANKAAVVSAPEPATPEAVAQRLIRQRLGGGDVRFEDAHAFAHDGATVVCGSYSQPGHAHQRFVAVTGVDLWLEPDMAPGQMDRAFTEFCRNGAANA